MGATVVRTPGRLIAAVGETRRQQTLSAVSAALGVVVVVLVLADQLRWAIAGAAVLLTVALLVLLDLRRRLGPMADRIKTNAENLRRLENGGFATGGDTHFDAMTRRVITAIESGRLEAAERHSETVAVLDQLSRKREETSA